MAWYRSAIRRITGIGAGRPSRKSTNSFWGFLRKISGQLGGDFYLLPSSIHEVLVLRAEQNVDESALTEMVREVNRREVAEEERLSDYAYRYDAESGMLLKIA